MLRTGFEIGVLDPRDTVQLNDAAAVATRAFQFDPFFVYLSPRPLQRARGLGIFFRSQIAALGGRSEMLAARQPDGRLVGVACWVKPDGYPLPVGVQLRQSLGAFWALIPRPKALVDGTRYISAIDKAHPKEPSWYLFLLVADPSVQRSGIGTELQQTVLQRADADGLPAYLETQNLDNLADYRRFGYEVADELHPVPRGPPLWTMRREPRTIS
ncbi:MAG TPA: GNAT family N-acetyltransferase [Acidimicrobiales bacterium]|nr:GNAT family N-acetyltransferase [Acidimicrobiales bacterium]